MYQNYVDFYYNGFWKDSAKSYGKSALTTPHPAPIFGVSSGYILQDKFKDFNL